MGEKNRCGVEEGVLLQLRNEGVIVGAAGQATLAHVMIILDIGRIFVTNPPFLAYCMCDVRRDCRRLLHCSLHIRAAALMPCQRWLLQRAALFLNVWLCE